ncbi:MAG: flagellar motor stator protein MotA, partial [candidate division Zixibacteria bacterium]|nr:flagellar motor stator protein MotA [candidate division Zixibacteria bacterium]
MLVFVGAIVVLGSVLGGYMWHGGQVLALNQPNEVLIIGGAALGALIISTPVAVLKSLIKQITGVLGGGFVKKDYLDILVMMFEVFNVARRDGLVGLENHIEHPDDSEIFQRYPKFLKNHEAMAFFADTM